MKFKRLNRKRIVLAALITFSCCIVLAQNSDYSAILLSIDGEGKVLREGEELKLSVPTSFIAGDKVTLTKGNATVLLFSGKELSMEATNNYDIPGIETGSTQLSELASGGSRGQGLLGQSEMAYRTRGENNVFPVKSKIIDKNNAIIRFTFEEPNQNPLSFKLVDSKTQKTIYSKENITDSTLSLAGAEFEDGKSYYFTVTGLPSGKPVMGVITPAANSDQKIIEAAKEKDSHFDYIESILILHQNNYYFEAMKLLEEAIKKFPEAEIYQKIKENLLLNY